MHKEYDGVNLVSQHRESSPLRTIIMIYYFKFGAITVHLDQHNYNSDVTGYLTNKTSYKLKHLRCLPMDVNKHTGKQSSLLYNIDLELLANNITFDLWQHMNIFHLKHWKLLKNNQKD